MEAISEGIIIYSVLKVKQFSEIFPDFIELLSSFPGCTEVASEKVWKSWNDEK